MRLRTRSGHGALLTYCANAHPGETLTDVMAAISRFAGPIRRELALPEIHCLDAFPSEDDEPLATLYRDAGYRRMDVHRVMQAALGDAATATTASLETSTTTRSGAAATTTRSSEEAATTRLTGTTATTP